MTDDIDRITNEPDPIPDGEDEGEDAAPPGEAEDLAEDDPSTSPEAT